MEGIPMEEMLELEDATALVLRGGGDGRLVAFVDGRPVSVRVRKCYPWSEPRRFLSLRDDE